MPSSDVAPHPRTHGKKKKNTYVHTGVEFQHLHGALYKWRYQMDRAALRHLAISAGRPHLLHSTTLGPAVTLTVFVASLLLAFCGHYCPSVGHSQKLRSGRGSGHGWRRKRIHFFTMPGKSMNEVLPGSVSTMAREMCSSPRVRPQILYGPHDRRAFLD